MTNKPSKLVLKNLLSPGDVLVMSAAVEMLATQHPGLFDIGLDVTAPAIYEHNPHITLRRDDADGATEVGMEYPLVHSSNQRPLHFLEAYVDYLGQQLRLPLEVRTNRPHLYLSDDERNWISQVHEMTGSRTRFWVINAGIKDDFTTKGWGHANYQRVVDLLRGRVIFVQVGESGHNHRPLSGVINLVGRTDTRQLIRLCWNSSGGLGPTTFIQHIMAALQKPYVCVLGGREPVRWVSYPLQHTLHTVGMLPCCAAAACWKSRTVPLHDGRDGSLCAMPALAEWRGATEPVPTCMTMIKPEHVAQIIGSYGMVP